MIKHKKFLSIRVLAAVLLAVGLPFGRAWAQEQDSAIAEIEELFAEEEAAGSPVVTSEPKDTKKEEEAVPPVELKGVSDLSKLQAFKDVAVIQKRFLPKSNRFEFYIGPSLNLNDAFFFSFGADARLGYHFSERYGVELALIYLMTSDRQVTEDLLKRGVKTTSFVSPRGYYGVDFKWTPSYGKMTWRNEKIVPFDLYFTGGVGLTPTNQDQSEFTIHLSTGQIFALSKGSGVRWDLSWFMYNSESAADPSGGRGLYHNVLFSLGWSGFFPEATYR